MDRFKVGYHTGDAQALRNRYVSAYGPKQEVILWAMFESSSPLGMLLRRTPLHQAGGFHPLPCKAGLHAEVSWDSEGDIAASLKACIRVPAAGIC